VEVLINFIIDYKCKFLKRAFEKRIIYLKLIQSIYILKTTLIITTYNWPKALELVLKSAEHQTHMPDEIIVADDGSGLETKKVVENFIDKLPLTHLWHEDEGFRRTVILNKALAKADGDYIIQLDGDCIMHPQFIEDHYKNMQRNTFLYGSRVNIKKEFVENLYKTKNIVFPYGDARVKNKTRNFHHSWLQKLYSPSSKLSEKLRGCNLSYFKKDIIAINGYNENMTGWGREDSEMAIRLLNKGIKGKRLRYGGIIYHIWHLVVEKSRLNINDSIQQKALDEKLTWCDEGLKKYLTV